jgi:hypothetical protein
LIANADVDLILGEQFALRSQVYADDPGKGTKEPLPHLKRSSFPAAYFEEHNVRVYKSPEMTLVCGEIMLPLVNEALVIGQEVRPQSHTVIVLVLSSPIGRLSMPGEAGWIEGDACVPRGRKQRFISIRLPAAKAGLWQIYFPLW